MLLRENPPYLYRYGVNAWKSWGSTYVVAAEVVEGSLRQHAVVLKLALAERRSVASNDDELGLAGAEALEGWTRVSDSSCSSIPPMVTHSTCTPE